ncbi:MAG: hypothetical protein BWY31_04369 [Lentisphaerae bacterium ADurb.Bin242]|nr:MAG: hypothetical protein BWY31_04369 [Lentisphaerae bacterium ADurb.Bin242]
MRKARKKTIDRYEYRTDNRGFRIAFRPTSNEEVMQPAIGAYIRGAMDALAAVGELRAKETLIKKLRNISSRFSRGETTPEEVRQCIKELLA